MRAVLGRVDPQNGDDYTANPDYPAAPELPTNSENFVVYKGPGTSLLVTGLTMRTSYSVAVYEYSGTGPSPTYLEGPDEATDATTDYAVHNYDNRVDCDDCHNHGAFGARGPELKAVCSTCHNPSGLASTKLEFGFEEVPTTTGHTTPTKNPGIDIVDCGMCHELHKPGGSNTTESYNPETEPPQTQHNKSFLRANVGKYVDRTPLPAPRDAYLHTDPGDRAVEGGDDTTATGYCQVCHSMTSNHRSTDTAGATQTHDGASNDSGTGTEVNCGICHDHNNNFAASGGSCTGCHASGQGIRPAIVSQFDRNSSHIPADSTVTDADCEVCHDQTGHPGDQIVGLLDADIYGPSQPQMVGLAGTQPASDDGKTMRPLEAHGIQVMSIGFLVDADQPMIWRGPMVTSALQQLLHQTSWRDLDYLIIDMPPGTGDIQLSLSQQVPVSGAVIVTTPQNIATLDARKGLAMFRKVSVPVLGIIENMSTHICSECGREEPIFGTGGGELMAADFDVELLGQLPLDPKIREQTDGGNPTVAADPDSAAASAYRLAARRMTAAQAVQGRDYSSKFPKIVVEDS
jgi:Mrp family chromosome partitioning ATPase